MLQNARATGSVYLRNRGTTNERKFEILYAGDTKFTMDNFGNVGIGTTNPGNYKLAVEGTIGAREVKVTADGWSDFVFKDDYNLKDLDDVEKYIINYKSLPDVPTEHEVIENGVNLGEMDAKLLQKIEELTLYMIEMKWLKLQNSKLEEKINKLETVQ